MVEIAKNENVIYHTVVLGCDPELFFEDSKGRIVGAEKVIPETGLSSVGNGLPASYQEWGSDKALILDGVQIELNPAPSHCRANLGNSIQASFRTLRKHLAGMNEIRASFKTVVEVDKEELQSLSDKAKILGCAPSNNLYDKNASISVDPTIYRKRSAGGHIHIGLKSAIYNLSHLMDHREELVPLLDTLVGLPSVLIDRDPEAVERRKVYGRAGEYRLPDHGLEYRTLSNYWLRSYQLFSFVMGMTRLAVCVLGTKYINDAPGDGTYWPRPTGKMWDAPSRLLEKVDLELVREAINKNDLVLAKRAFTPVKEFIKDHVRGIYSGLQSTDIANFEFFCQKVEEEGIEFWFPQDPIEHWSNMPEGHHYTGWESFLTKHVEKIRTGLKSTFKVTY